MWVVYSATRKVFGAEGEIRTHTGNNSQRFLRPPRLPFRHFGRGSHIPIIPTTRASVNVCPVLEPGQVCWVSVTIIQESLKRRRFSKSVLSTVFEDEGDCLPKITPGFFLGHSLTVGAGNFRTICYVPVVVFLDDGSKFIPHIRLPQSILSLALQSSAVRWEKSSQATLATLKDSSTNHSPWYFCRTSDVTSM